MTEFWLTFSIVIPLVSLGLVIAWNLSRERPRTYRDNPKRRPF